MPRRIPISAKLACALAVPLAGLAVGTGFTVVDATRNADEAAAEASLAAAAVGPASLVSQLQNERDFTSIDLIGMASAVRLPVSSVDGARSATDASLAELRAFVTDRGPEAEAAFAEGLAAVESGLETVRTRVDGYGGPRSLENHVLGDEVFDAYAEIVDALLDGTAGLALRVEDAELRTGVEIVGLTTRLYELRSRTIRDAVAATLAGDTGPEVRAATAGALAEANAMEETIVERSVEPYDGIAQFSLNDASIIRQEGLLNGFALGAELDVAAVLDSVESGPEAGVQLVRRQVAQRLLEEANAVVGSAEERRVQVVTLGGALVVLAVALTWFVSRSITRPLRSLTRQAEAMAGTTLPAAVQRVLDTPLGEDVAIADVEPIAVKTRDEVRDVAAALNVVQRSALELAVEQAVLRRNIADSFVNMGRRNQNLLDRQLDFITDLENEEADPDALASLFRLDHLATRMRRNAESLLRLAGSEPQRRRSAPIEIADVVRGALGEVEDFQRVEVRALDPAAVPGGVGADLAHAVAELLENALSFSPPTEPVEVRGRMTPEAYVLAVADSGLGMTPDELLVANRRLAGEESFTVAPSRYLGHYVAGHLASRLGMRIELVPGAAGGLVARVDIPTALLVDMPVERADAWTPEWPAEAVSTDAAQAVSMDTVDEPPEDDEVPVSPFMPSIGLFTEPTEPKHPQPQPVDGFGGLAATVPASDEVVDGGGFGTTASGLVRRVPGAQHPSTELAGRPRAAAEPDASAEDATPDAVSSFLSNFSAGVARGITDAGHDPWEDLR